MLFSNSILFILLTSIHALQQKRDENIIESLTSAASSLIEANGGTVPESLSSTLAEAQSYLSEHGSDINSNLGIVTAAISAATQTGTEGFVLSYDGDSSSSSSTAEQSVSEGKGSSLKMVGVMGIAAAGLFAIL